MRMIKSAILTGVSAGALLIYASPALAKDAESKSLKDCQTSVSDNAESPQDCDTKSDEIVVTGSRAQAESFVTTKKESTAIVDSISENQAGNLPAQNVAELVSVLPGINSVTDRTGSDNLTTTESRFANVRGIRADLNITTMDGMNLAIPNQGGRSNFLDWFPVSLARRVEVIKSFAAENDGNAIGGQVNVVTRSGFDYPRGLFNLTGSVSFDQLHKGVTNHRQPFNLSGVFARPLSDTVSIALTANFNRRDSFIPSKENVGRIAFNPDGSRATFFPGFNNFIGPVPGNGIAVPLTNRLYFSSSPTDRWGAAGKIDFRPDDKTYVWLTGSYSRLDQRVLQSYSDVRSAFICFSFFGCTNKALSQTGDTGTLQIQFNDAAFSEMYTGRNLSQLSSAQFGAQRQATDSLSIEFKGSYSVAKQDQDDYFSFFGQDSRPILVNYDLSNPLNPQFQLQNPQAILDPSTYHLRHVDYIPLRLTEKVFDGQFNVSYNSGEKDRGFGVKVGVRLKTSARTYREKFIENDVTALGGTTFTLNQFQTPVDVFNIDIPGLNRNSYPVLGNPLLRNQVLLPQLGDSTLFTPNVLSDLGNDYALNEKTFAGFVQAQYRNDNVQFIAGLRYELTDRHGSGYRSTDGGAFVPTISNSSQGILLPSAILNWDPTDKLRLRASYSRSLGRPPYDAIAPKGETLTTDPVLGTASLSRSNPDLKPRRSDNFDVAAEWNFAGRGSLLSVGGFYKKIKDEIFVANSIVPMTFNGITYATTISQPANTTSAKLYGLETSFVYNFNFLPGVLKNLGINANATLIRGDFDLQRQKLSGVGTETPGFLPGQPQNVYNVSLFYSSDKLDVNVAWNRTAAYVAGFFADAPQNDIYILGRNTINAKASYALLDKFTLFVEGNNLTSQDLVEVSGPPRLQNIRRVYNFGRTISVGATLKF